MRGEGGGGRGGRERRQRRLSKTRTQSKKKVMREEIKEKGKAEEKMLIMRRTMV